MVEMVLGFGFDSGRVYITGVKPSEREITSFPASKLLGNVVQVPLIPIKSICQSVH